MNETPDFLQNMIAVMLVVCILAWVIVFMTNPDEAIDVQNDTHAEVEND